MSIYRRYGILFIFAVVFFVPTSLFINNVYTIHLNEHIKYEMQLKKSVYDILSIKHMEHSQDIYHILSEIQQIKSGKYMLVNFEKNSINIFNSHSFSAFRDKIYKRQQLKISKFILEKDNYSVAVELDQLWYILTFIKVKNTQKFIVALSLSKEVSILKKNKQISYYMLVVVLFLILILLHKFIKHTQKIKEEKERISSNLQETKQYFDNAVIGFLIVDKDGKILNVNPSACEMFLYKESELIGQSVKVLYLSEKSYERWRKLIYFKSKNDSLISIRYKMKKSDGETFWAEITGRPSDKKRELFDGGVVWTTSDVTKQIAHVSEIKRLNEEHATYLEHRIEEEVTKNLIQAKEQEKVHLRDVKFSAIGQLSAGITHEINTPLTYVKGSIEMMKMDLDILEDSKIKENLLDDFKHAYSGLNKIATIVESMREMSQHTKETKERVNIYNTITTSLVMAYNRSKHLSKVYLNNREFNLDFEKKEFIFLSNVQEQRVEQVWVILVNNALDELQKIEQFEARELNIECCEEGGNIVVYFKDNAGGIDDDILENIFEPFVSSKSQGGMGVGLSIARKIIQDQDGYIEANNDNNGAVFKITLPKA